MFATGDPASHEEAWRALPWLANGRISQAERDRIEPHVRTCTACRGELAFQRLLCNALTEPDRVTYAPGPSFRKLMDRIDGVTQPRKRRAVTAASIPAVRQRNSRGSSQGVSLWRPPGLAWAASFVLLVGVAGMMASAYQSSRAYYRTHSDATHVAANVLHIAFDRSVTIGEVEEALRSSGAHIVEGPDSTGVLGVAPGVRDSDRAAPKRLTEELRVLSARLRADPRVRWVEPIADDNSPGEARVPTPRGP
jgi:Putative zinc-finger